MIEPKIIEALDRVLGSNQLPEGCCFNSVDPSKVFSFWESLELIPSLRGQNVAKTKQQELLELVARTKEDIQRLRNIADAKACPIIAVCGLLNSGKSSLVAGFLSDLGRKRVLVGSGDDSGTHRFVIWLPESWKRNTLLWQTVLNQIRDIFGRFGVLLSDDPKIAHEQYNGCDSINNSTRNEASGTKSLSQEELFATPLIATDPMLDVLQVGLMDCPDIQSGVFRHVNFEVESNPTTLAKGTDDWSKKLEKVSDLRARGLLNGLRLASGLVVVVQSNMIGDVTLERLVESASSLLPHIRKFLAINRVPKRYDAAEIAAEVPLHFSKVTFDNLFMAYDFRGPDGSRKLPPAPTQWTDIASSKGEPLPIFVSIDSKTKQSSGDSVTPNYLIDLRSQLDVDQLASELLQSSISRTTGELQSCFDELRSTIAQSQQQNLRLYRCFGDAILRFTANHQNGTTSVRLQLSEEIIEQMKCSLERTAPWWAKPTQILGRWSTSASAKAKELTKRIPGLPKISEKMGETAEWIRKRFQRGEGGTIMTAEQLALALRQSDRYGDLPPAESIITQDRIVKTADRIIQRFQAESHARLNDEALDRCTALLWKQMSWKQKLYTGAAPATLIFAPIIAVVTVPIDFGTSHVLVFATVKELLLAGVASAGLFLLQSDQFPEIAEGQAAWKQVSDLFAITCDEFGRGRPAESALPSLTIGQIERQLLASTTSVGSSTLLPIGVDLCLQPRFEASFKSLMATLRGCSS